MYANVVINVYTYMCTCVVLVCWSLCLIFRYLNLKRLLVERRKKLENSRRLQQFLRDCHEARMYILQFLKYLISMYKKAKSLTLSYQVESKPEMVLPLSIVDLVKYLIHTYVYV